jgi:hypothetical protein
MWGTHLVWGLEVGRNKLRVRAHLGIAPWFLIGMGEMTCNSYIDKTERLPQRLHLGVWSYVGLTCSGCIDKPHRLHLTLWKYILGDSKLDLEVL